MLGRYTGTPSDGTLDLHLSLHFVAGPLGWRDSLVVFAPRRKTHLAQRPRIAMDLTLLVDGQSVWLPAAATVGVGIGLVAGLFGVGGGFLLVPLLHVFLGVPLVAAVGVALCQTIATALGSFLRYRKLGHAESRFDLMLLGGSVLGVHAGKRALEYFSASGLIQIGSTSIPTHRVIITGLYVLLFSVLSFFLWTKSAEATGKVGPFCRVSIPPYTRLPVAGVERVSGPFVGTIGFINGMLAGLLGIGGGICLVPIMLYGFGFDIRKVAGTGIVVVLVVALVGTFQYASAGHVHLGLAMTLMIGSGIAAQIGAGLTSSLSPRLLRKGLAVVMVITIVALLIKLFR